MMRYIVRLKILCITIVFNGFNVVSIVGGPQESLANARSDINPGAGFRRS